MRIFSALAPLAAAGLVFLGSSTTLLAQGSPSAGGAARPAVPPTGNPVRPTNPPPAAAAQPRDSAGQVVVIDINEVFKQHLRHKAALEDIKTAAKKIEADAQEQQKQLGKLRDKLADFNPGTKAFKETEEEFARKSSELSVTMKLMQKDFIEREAKVYYNTYTEVCEQVADFSQRNGISLVLRFSNSDIDPAKPDTVAVGIQRPVVYHSNLDITKLIIERVNRGTPPVSNKSPAIPPRTQLK